MGGPALLLRVSPRSFSRFVTVLVRRKCLRAPHRAAPASSQAIDSRPRTLTIPITTANSAVQSNEVYLTPCSTVPSLQLRLGVR
jgi:hypothetical protein